MNGRMLTGAIIGALFIPALIVAGIALGGSMLAAAGATFMVGSALNISAPLLLTMAVAGAAAGGLVAHNRYPQPEGVASEASPGLNPPGIGEQIPTDRGEYEVMEPQHGINHSVMQNKGRQR